MKISDLSTLKKLSSKESSDVCGGQLPGVPAYLSYLGVVTQAPTNTSTVVTQQQNYETKGQEKPSSRHGRFYKPTYV